MISVIIPTYKPKIPTLVNTLESLSKQTGIENYEVIVVENPVWTEQTKSLVEGCGFSHAFCGLGSNVARNHGISLAQHPLIALTDDDVIVSNSWVSRLIGLHGLYPDVGVIGGSLSLEFEEAPPLWVDGMFSSLLSEVDWEYNSHTTEIENSQYLVSANLSFRKSVWEKVGGFPEAGLMGDDLAGNDEVEFVKSCRALGNPSLIYDPDLLAYHHIPPERCELGYFKRRMYGQGKADARDWEEDTIPNLFYNHVQGIASNFIDPYHIMSMREKFCNEEVTREYIKNYIICKTEYMRGIIEGISE